MGGGQAQGAVSVQRPWSTRDPRQINELSKKLHLLRSAQLLAF